MNSPGTALPAPLPASNPETAEFWAATTEGRLLVRRCQDCGHLIWYPRAICPECSSLATDWFEVSGRGSVYSYTVNYRGEGAYQGSPPFVLAYVELDEGPRLLTNIVEAGAADLAVGLPVEVVFHDTGQGAFLPRFRPRLQPGGTTPLEPRGQPARATTHDPVPDICAGEEKTT
jgi:uncharacterized protein